MAACWLPFPVKKRLKGAFSCDANADAAPTTRRLALPLWQQPHARRAQDVEGRLLVLRLGDVGGGEAQQGVEVVAGLRRSLRQGGDTWGGNQTHHFKARLQSPPEVVSERLLTNAKSVVFFCLSPATGGPVKLLD